MTNPAKNIFWNKADLGFYTARTDTVTITVKEDSATVTTYTYDRTTGMWMDGSSEATLPELLWVDYDKELSATGKWCLKKDAKPVDKPTDNINVAIWINRYISPASEPAPRTVYMDSNIALTDGKAPVGSGNAKTIPNLYEAIHDMDTRIDAIDKDFAISTADAGLHINPIVTDDSKKKYANFLRKPSSTSGIAVPGIEISVGDGFEDGVIKRNADKAQKIDDYNMHFRANEITFTVSNPNQIINEAYKIIETPTTPFIKNVDYDDENEVYVTEAFDAINIADTAQGTAENLIGLHHTINDENSQSSLKGNVILSYYWVPLEDHDAEHGKINIAGANDGMIDKGLHGNIFVNVKYKDQDAENAILIAAGAEEASIEKRYALLVKRIMDKNGSLVYAKHAVVVADGGLGVKAALTGEARLTVTGEMTYNLGAIIEAIQELNRRTMFMDTDMSFNGAMSYNDYNPVDSESDTMHYGHVFDGLPAATDSSLGQHYGSA